MREKIEQAIENLLEEPCSFFACNGPNDGLEYYITCRVCRTIILLREALEEGDK